MKAGRELDALIAEKVMGYEDIFNVGDYWYYNNDLRFPVPCFSKFVADAWLVREWILDNIGGVTLYRLCDEKPELCEIWDGEQHIRVNAETAPLAICLAALKACGVEVEG